MAGYARYSILPKMGWRIDMPDLLVNSDRFKRVHKKIAKQAAVAMMKSHQVHRLERHFKRDARHKYNHARRSPEYNAIKKRKYGSAIDLVKTGRLRKHVLMNNHQIQVGGDALSQLRVRMFVTFPFPMQDMSDKPSNVRRDGQPVVSGPQMMKELEQWTEQDVADCAKDYEKFYGEALQAELNKAPRWKKQIAAAKGAVK